MKKKIFYILLAVAVCFFAYENFRDKKYVSINGREIEKVVAKGCETFQSNDVVGTFVLLNTEAEKVYVCNDERAFEEKLPFSTFKIVTALAALENKIVLDENELFSWDGVVRDLDAWNKDTSLASGMKNSTVWFYQGVARRIGKTRMQNFVTLLEYGNQEVGGEIDRFWLDGNLRISPFQQLAFLEKLYYRKLPVSVASQDIVVQILEQERGDNWVLYGKTGSGSGEMPLGWLVGFAEYKGTAYLYALNLDMKVVDPKLRFELVKKLLSANGALPKM